MAIYVQIRDSVCPDRAGYDDWGSLRFIICLYIDLLDEIARADALDTVKGARESLQRDEAARVDDI